ncbi:RNA polymerase II transcription factor B subunit 4 [Taphrina deformans PYCC 5710]|uniref:General transcription and DNA repair factor IIH subunit TFB4 n=1 Tax=Taphrina deformans (strain PYCC 5710 / ATCC 11124 / CBS 356.35 / IMI 108563 / JCM 9778 / NBRC 8474) TaxID=1097556 RepID=R4X8G7_TAPDE|nr:RNA polymerase II transcription factor B subunit 4 [Taphrina deformans PYCC 5710]|eukprot:CCG81596.1 RNA polymerase II transcription factor B subunit 4 [Taphrina deformans PYCC 5710]
MDRFDTLRHLNDDATHQDKNEGSLVVFILDTNPSAWASLSSPTLQQSLADIFIFLNAHLALSHTNKTAVIASHIGTARFLYPSPEETFKQPSERDLHREANAYKPFLAVQDEVLHNISTLLNSTTQLTIETSRTSMMSGAITLALSYINRHASSVGSSRIMILSVSGDLEMQYIPMMNCIFSAQKQKVMIDIAKVGGDAVFLQQASDATKGCYRNVRAGESLLGYLMGLFLPDQHVRRDLNLPAVANVDFRAACFCHKKVLDVGFVCSVCLSIFCQALPKCITCDSTFDVQEMKTFGAKPAVLIKKKKKGGPQLQQENSIVID